MVGRAAQAWQVMYVAVRIQGELFLRVRKRNSETINFRGHSFEGVEDRVSDQEPKT